MFERPSKPTKPTALKGLSKAKSLHLHKLNAVFAHFLCSIHREAYLPLHTPFKSFREKEMNFKFIKSTIVGADTKCADVDVGNPEFDNV